MEYQVLDNLPHDLVYSPDQVSPWMEVWIEKINGRFVIFRLFRILAKYTLCSVVLQLKGINVCFYCHCLCGVSIEIIEIL
jgi:hypothetical protein